MAGSRATDGRRVVRFRNLPLALLVAAEGAEPCDGAHGNCTMWYFAWRVTGSTLAFIT